MNRTRLLLRAAAFERSAWFVEIALFFSFAAWVPDGYRPLWLPAALALAGVAFTRAMIGTNRLLSNVTDRILRRDRSDTIEIADRGFSLGSARGRRSASCAWSEIERAYAFKRDLGTTDLVCLAFVTRDSVVEVDESATGWRDLVAALPERLPGCETFATWYLDVVLIPFEPQLRSIYGAPAGDETDGARAILETLVPEDDDDQVPGAMTVRDYLGIGTTGMYLAVAGLTAAVGLVHGPRSLVAVAAVTLVEIALTRAILFAILARRPAD
jgi:hypothetical protein